MIMLKRKIVTLNEQTYCSEKKKIFFAQEKNKCNMEKFLVEIL